MEVDQARALDDHDELAAFRERFVPIDDPTVVAYLDGNSLGRPPMSTMDSLVNLLTYQWGSRMIRSWEEGWLELPGQTGDLLGEACLGAAAGQVVVADSTTVCLYKVLTAALAANPGRTEIITDAYNFPTDRFVVEAVAEQHNRRVTWVETDLAEGIKPTQLDITEDTAVVTLSHVAYRSAYIADLAGINELAHEKGALTVWDLCHSAGALPIHLDQTDTDFAVGCTYKFLNAGPGAPAFLYVSNKHQENFKQPIRGWMGTEEIFAMDDRFQPAQGIRRALSGTPPIAGILCVKAAAELVAEAGIDRIRAKSTRLSSLVIELVDKWLVPKGFTLASPRDDNRRGAHLTLHHRDAEELTRKFIDHGVIVDFRAPNGVRIGLSPLSTGYAEVWTALDLMRRLS
jgi:kynureninase